MNTRQAISERNQSTEPKLLCAYFNQDQDCFAIGHENGFRVYSTDPMVMRVKRTFHKTANSSKHGQGERCVDGNGSTGSTGSNNGKEHRSGIGHVSMLHRTNFLSLVGGGKNPKFPLNKVIIYDDLKKKNTLSLEFMSPILNVFLSRIRIIVVVETHIYVYAFSSPPKKIATYETISNPHGIADLSNSLGAAAASPEGSSGHSGVAPHASEILAFPGRQTGQIQIVDISPLGQERNLVSIIKAHKSRIRCLALNRAGTMVASASETGTIVRVYSVANCSLLYEFRRGLDKAIVYSIKFSPNGSKLAVLSDKQTLHVFKLSHHDQSKSGSAGSSLRANSPDPDAPSSTVSLDNANRQHFLKSLPIFTNYFSSQWSFVSCHLNQPHLLAPESRVATKNTDKYIDDLNVNSRINDRGVLGWSNEDSIVIIWKFRGKWEKYVIINNGTKQSDDGKNTIQWSLVREGWRSFGNLSE